MVKNNYALNFISNPCLAGRDHVIDLLVHILDPLRFECVHNLKSLFFPASDYGRFPLYPRDRNSDGPG
jgi:hypothetical protein